MDEPPDEPRRVDETCSPEPSRVARTTRAAAKDGAGFTPPALMAALALFAAGSCGPTQGAVRTGTTRAGTPGPGADVAARTGTGRPQASESRPLHERPRLLVVRAGSSAPAADLPVLRVEVSANDRDRSRGLGGRNRLERDHGMVFVYPAPTSRTFWMKDCPIALDIAFVSPEGRIRRLVTLPPGAGKQDAEIASAASGGPVLWVLEAAAGWFDAHGIREGDLVDLSAAIEGVVAQ